MSTPLLSRIIGNIIVISFGIFFGFLILEGMVRITDFISSYRLSSTTQTTNTLGTLVQDSDAFGLTTFKPNLDVVREAENTVDEPVNVITNSYGYVGKDYPKEKEAGVFRILASGDSFTAADGVNTKDNFVSLLERDLSVSHPTEVINFGIGGQGTFEELFRYENVASLWQHDLVILFFYPNDFENNQYYLPYLSLLTEGADWESIPFSNANNRFGRPDFKYKLLKMSRLLQVLDSKVRGNASLESIAIKIGLHHSGVMGLPRDNIHQGFFIYEIPLSSPNQEVYDLTSRMLSLFKSRVEAHGAKFAIVYIPEPVAADPSVWEEKKRQLPSLDKYQWDLDQPERFIADSASKLGIPFLDLTPSLREAFANASTSKALYANRSGHFTREGHDFVTRVLVPFVTGLRD